MQPAFHIGRRGALEREEHAVMLAAEKYLSAVAQEPSAVGAECGKAAAHLGHVLAAERTQRQVRRHGRILIPERRVIAEGHRDEGFALVIGADGQNLRGNIAVLAVLAAPFAVRLDHADGALHGEVQRDLPARGIRHNLDGGDAFLIVELQLDPAGDAVPVGLGVLGGHMPAGGRVVCVVHADDKLQLSGAGKCRQVIDMRRTKAVLRADELPVDPERRDAGAL